MKNTSRLSVLAYSLLFTHGACQAVDVASLEFGHGNKTQMARIGLQWDWNDKWFEQNGSHVGAYWEFSLAQWRGERYQNMPDRTQSITDVGMTPVLRWQRDDKKGLYAEAGIGAHWLSALYDNNTRRLSTNFQFGSQLDVGYVFGNKIDVGLKIQHLSNGGIKQPNSGVNFVILRTAYKF